MVVFRSFHLSSERFGAPLRCLECRIFSDYLVSVKDAYCVISQISLIAEF